MDMFRPADIGFVRTVTNPMSVGIAAVMGSEWSHTFLVTSPETTIETEIALPFRPSVHVDNLKDHLYNEKKEVEVWTPEFFVNREEIVKRALELKGKPYSYPLMVALGIRCLCFRKFENFYRRGIVCETVICHAYGLDKWKWDTEEFYRWVKNSGQFRRIYKREAVC